MTATDPLRMLREGMPVVDSHGKEVGKVGHFRVGDESTVSPQGPRDPDRPSILKELLAAIRDRSIERPQVERMLAIGYVVIDRKGLFAGNDHIAADRLDRIEGGVLWLKPRRAK